MQAHNGRIKGTNAIGITSMHPQTKAVSDEEES